MGKWQKDKDLRKLECEIENSLLEWMEQLEAKVLDIYCDSDGFCIDALQYAREQGWQPPE